MRPLPKETVMQMNGSLTILQSRGAPNLHKGLEDSTRCEEAGGWMFDLIQYIMTSSSGARIPKGL
jgi:hypothetical protein